MSPDWAIKHKKIARAVKSRPGGGKGISRPFLNLRPNLRGVMATFYWVTMQTSELQELTSHPHVSGRQAHEWHKK